MSQFGGMIHPFNKGKVKVVQRYIAIVLTKVVRFISACLKESTDRAVGQTGYD